LFESRETEGRKSMADEVVEPTGAADETPDAPEGAQPQDADAAPQDTDVSDLPLDESPEAHIRRAIAGDGGDGEAAKEAPAAGEAGEAEPAEEAEPAGE
jgi:hypothetical protein